MNAKLVLLVFTALIIGCGISSLAHHYLYGYYYEVKDEEALRAGPGTVKLRHVLETRGVPFLESEKSVIVLAPADGPEVKIFEAEPTFKKKLPQVSHVNVSDSEVSWNDGVRSYRLLIEPLADEKSFSAISAGRD